MNLRRLFRFSPVILTIILLILGAGSTLAQEKGKVTVWWSPTGGDDCRANTVTPLFNAQSQNNEVEWLEKTAPSPDEYSNLLRTSIMGGTGPDIIQTPSPAFTAELAKAGFLRSLDEFIAQYNWDQKIAPWALGLVKVDDQSYAIPDELESIIIYYNETLFEQQGWAPPQTIDELVALAETIQETGIIPFGHAFAGCQPCNDWFLSVFLNHWAGPNKVREALLGELSFTDPDFVESMNIYGAMPGKGWFMGSLENFFSMAFPDNWAAFGQGDVAMIIEGTWAFENTDQFFGEAAGNTNDWNWVPFPTRSGGELWTIGFGSSLSINASSTNPEGAAEYLDFWFQPDTQVALLEACGKGLGPIQVPENAFSGLDPRFADANVRLTNASSTNNIGYLDYTFFPPKTEVYLYTEIEKLYTGDITAEQYLEGAQTQFQEEFDAGAVPPVPITNGTN